MAPRTGRGKGSKSKAEKKKKDEKATAVDITVVTPYETQITLKGISTDKIIDVRKLLGSNVETCHITNYSLEHVAKGKHLSDGVEIMSLKPCVLRLVEEDYETEENVVAHVRRLLDIVACTAFFSKHQKSDGGSKARKHAASSAIAVFSAISSPATTTTTTTVDGQSEDVSVPSISAKYDMAAIQPLPKLGDFYDFFSFSNLPSPIQYIRREADPSVMRREGDHFEIEVKVCNGKSLCVVAGSKGFYTTRKHCIRSHSLVDLLHQRSRAFANAYDSLMRAFVDHNKFGNLPYGFRANTWLVPPFFAESPSECPSFPAEDVSWGGSGHGHVHEGCLDHRKWSKDFSALAAFPCRNAEERLIRDREAFLLHSLFVETAILNATSVIHRLVDSNTSAAIGDLNASVFYDENVGDLNIVVRRDFPDANGKLKDKIDGSQMLNFSAEELVQRNILKGLTANESVVINDTLTMGVVIVKQCGYTATVKVLHSADQDDCMQHLLEIEEQLDGGSNALNVNSLRILLHKFPTTESSVGCLSSYDHDKKKDGRCLAHRVISDSLNSVEEVLGGTEKAFRWELGACWLQHLQKNKSYSIEGGKENEEVNIVEPFVKGFGKQFEQLKRIRRKPDSLNCSFVKEDSDASDMRLSEITIAENIEQIEGSGNCELKKWLTKEAFDILKDSGTGLHQKSILELTKMACKYYDDIALPEFVADLASLELSPVDGRTLTDFMHTRGLKMCSLGRIVMLAEKLPHIQSLCVHEMVTRSFKHLVRAVVAAVKNFSDIANAVTAVLNVLFGSSKEGGDRFLANDHALMIKWLKALVLKRYSWRLGNELQNLKKFVILRGLCQKVGLELVARDYNLDSPNPFEESDIISIVPIYKHVVCSSIDGRNLLESSKTALDKGKLEDAVSYGTKALLKMIAVCGPYHRMTANAYSLLAVVLYHTGDFNQATIYQQKALDINEREIGLDHPETMKSYGDLSVFYYRLQHIELALKYANRALYLLYFSCGLSHPNSAATYINIAMMEEGRGNANVALRYLHEALKCNQRLLGADHIQTAASYHAIAIALSMMEAYSLSVQHEQTTLQILHAKLGSEDLRTQDAAAWLEYFESKALEQQEAARRGIRMPDASIASKGHLSVSDLLDYINPNLDMKEKDVQKKHRHMKSNSKVNQEQSVTNQDDPYPIRTMIHHEEIEGLKLEEPEESHREIMRKDTKVPGLKPRQDDMLSIQEASDEGWQEASFRGKPNHLRQRSCSRRPALTKLVLNNSELSATETVGYNTKVVSPCSKSTFNRKLQKASPDIDASSEQCHMVSGTSRLSAVASKFVSYKEVAVSPPGTVLKPTIRHIVEVKDEVNDAYGHECVEKKEMSKEDLEESPSDGSEKERCTVEAVVVDIEEKPSNSSDKVQEFPDLKKVEVSSSRLSASAPPFNPMSVLSMSHPYSSIAFGGACDSAIARVNQHTEILFTESVYLRVPRGPRSSSYYRTGHSFRRKAVYPSCNTNASQSIMNPNAAEFVPAKEKNADVGEEVTPYPDESSLKQQGPTVVKNKISDSLHSQTIKVGNDNMRNETRSLQTTELGRQILLNLVVKSFQHSLISSPESKDTSAQAKSKHRKVKEKHAQSSNSAHFQARGVHNGEEKDAEGFMIVSKRRRSKQFPSAVHGLFAQQSICT